MKKLLTLLIVLVFSSITWGQTVLISHTGDGGFENGSTFAANGWITANDATNTWQVGTVSIPSAGSNAAFISNDNGVTNAYTINSAQVSYFYRDITVPAGESKISLTFKWKNNAESGSWDRIFVYTAPTTSTPVANSTTVAGSTDITGTASYLVLQTSYQTATYILPASLAGTTFRLIFGWKNDGSSGTQPPASVDEISLTSVAPDPLHGVYSINNTLPTSTPMVHNGTGNFHSFTDAVNYMNIDGISAAVTFNVSADQTFNEKPPAITATGTVTNTITFQKSGPGANPQITPVGTLSSSPYDFGICISGGDYITFDGIDIDASAATTATNAIEFGYLIRNISATDGAQYNTIKNCAVTLNKNYIATSSSGCIFSSTSSIYGGGVTPTNASGANSYNKYYNLTLQNAQNGIYLYGNSTYPDLSCEVGVSGSGCQTERNTITNMGGVYTFSASYGVYASYQNGIRIFNNDISNIRSNQSTTAGVLLYSYSGTSEIFNNKVSDISNSGSSSSTSRAVGIEVQNSSGTPTVRVYNNFIWDIKSPFTGTATASVYAYGIYCNNTSTATVAEIDNNSVYMFVAGTPTYSLACFAIGNSGTAVHKVRGNIFVNAVGAQGATAKHVCWYSTSATAIGGTGSVSNYNDLYITTDAGTSGFIGRGNTVYYATLANWQAITSTPDLNSISIDPGYTSATDLHVSATGINAYAGFTPQAWVTTDIDCDVRSATTPDDLGADAFTPPSCAQPTTLTASNLTYVSADISWTAPGSGSPVSYEWEVRTSGTGGSGSAGLVSNGTTTAPTVTASVSGLSGGTLYTLYVRTYCGGTDYSPWSSNTFSTLSCNVPTGITATSITVTSAVINWVAPLVGSPAGYEWEVRSSGAAGSGATGLAASGSTSAPTVTANASALTAQTTYSIYVRTLCYTGFYSSWTTAVTFTTPCNPFSLNVVEGFNTTSLPNCWSTQWVTSTGEKISFVATSTGQDALPQEGTNFVKFNSYSSSGGTYGAEERLITPPIITTGTPSVDVEFYWFQSGSTSYTNVAEGVQLEWSSDGSTWNNSTFFPRYVATASTSGEWVKKTVTLPAGAGNIPNLSVSFKFHSEYGYNCYLDNVTIKPSPDCLAPTGVTASSVTTTSAIINWTASTSNPTGGYDIYYSTSSTAPDAATTPTASVAAGVTTYPTGNTLTPNTLYYVWVRSNCGSSYSTWTSVITFFTGYCVPKPTSVDGLGITNVNFSTVNNPTGKETNNYGDYSAMIGNVTQGVNVPVNITYETGYTYVTKIWIDWNDDLDFADAGEEVYSGTSLSDNPTTLAASFVVPGTAPLGNLRMRIGGQDDGPVVPCYTGSFGTFEDYTVNVVAPALPVITSLGATSGCVGSSLTINGTDLEGASSVTIGGTAATITANTATAITVTIGTGTTGTVSVTTPGGTATSAETFIVNQLPAVFNVSGGGAYCAGGSGVTITLDGSVSGVNYDLSTTPVTTLAGNGSALTFGPSAFAAGVYTVTAADPITTCSIIMTGNANVTVNPIPSAVTATASNNTICEGNSVNLFSSANSNANISLNYTEGFETWPPTGWTFINAGSGNEWSSYSTSHSGSYCMSYLYNSDYSANAWGITQALTLSAGTNYTISFWYKVYGSSFPEKLKVTVGTAATVDGQTNVLWDNNGGSSLTNATWQQAVISFTPATSGTYYFGFNCYSDADEWRLYVDDLSITGTTIIPPSYSWTSNPAGFTSTDQNPVAVVPTDTTTYIVTATNSFNCSASANVTVNVNPIPVAPTVAVVNYCGNSTLTASAYTGTLAWSNLETGPSITVTTAGTYTVNQTVNGCTSPNGSGIAAPFTFPVVTAVTLQSSTDQTNWSTVSGDLVSGYSMCIDPATPYHYLDINTLTGPVNALTGTFSQNAFKLDVASVPAGFYDYWAAKGVVSGASGWQGVMWNIISGTTPMFYINYTGTDYQLIDGMQYQAGGGAQTLKITGDYPQGNYKFTGSVTDVNGCTSSFFDVFLEMNSSPVVSDVTLLSSTDQATWDAVSGDIASGYSMCIDPVTPFYYLDINTLTGPVNPLTGTFAQNAFKLDVASVPSGFYAYWAAKGVVSGASGWQGVMWNIINGTAPMFYINYTGTDYQLIDGMQYQLGGGAQKLRITGDYPQGNYKFTGSVTDVNGCASSFFDVFLKMNSSPVVSDVTLLSSTDQATWTAVSGDLGSGYSMCINPATPYHYLDINTLIGPVNPLTGTFAQNAFKLDVNSVPAGFYAYWAAKGVVSGASGWQGVMWNIINGTAPMFYINYTGTDYQLIDGMQYQLGGGAQTLKITGDYPQGNYKFTGSVTDVNGCTSSFFDVFLEMNSSPVVSDVTLLSSTDQATWDAVSGDIASGYSMCIDPVTPFYYLDINTLTGPVNPLTGTFAQNAFTLDVASVPAGFYAYWAAKGVVSGASGWQGVMWNIINGTAPMFYINYTGTDYQLIDGMQYQLGGGAQTLRITGDYPQANYKFTGSVTDVNGCASSFFDVFLQMNTVPAPPTIGTITHPTCAISSSVDLSGLPVSSWVVTATPGGSQITGNTSTATFTGLPGGSTYQFTVAILSSGCTSASSGPAVINEVPGAPPAPIVGTIIQPTCSVATGSVVLNGLPTGNWIINPGNIAGTGTSTTISNIATGTHNYSVTNDLGCTSSFSANIVINAQPVTPATPTVGTITQPTCASATGSVVLSGLPSGSWTINPGNIAGTGTTHTINGLAAGTYNFTVNNGSCTSVATANVVINTQPVTPAEPTVGTITQPTCALATGSVELSGLPSGSWTINPGTIAGTGTTYTVSGLAAGTYNFTVNNGSCTSIASANVVINAQPLPPTVSLGNDITICADESVTLDAGNTGATYFWTPGGQTSQTITVDSLGLGLGAHTISVLVTDPNTCSATGSIVVTFDPCTGIEANDGNIMVSIVPNPSNGMFYLNVDGINETVTLNIYTINGKVIYSEQVDNTGLINKPIDLKYYPKGMYFLRLINNNMTHTEKIIIE